MFNAKLTKWIAAVGAGATTLVLFSAVASLADSDKAAMLAARIKPTTTADAGSAALRN